MPYSKKQERLIRGIAHGWKPKKKGIDMTQEEARKLEKHIGGKGRRSKK